MIKPATGIVFTSFIFLAACGQNEQPPTPPTPVNLITVHAAPVLYFDRYPSTVQALNQVNLLPQVQGYITAIYFKEGDHVKKGQNLYEIDRRIYENAYNAAEANLKVAQGNLTQAQQDADRYTYLNNEKAVATQLYDHAIIALANAKNQVQAAAESVKTSRTNLTYSMITAPFDGTIGFSQVKLGNLVTVGQTVLNTISTDDPMALDFLINEKQLPHFEDIKNNTALMPDSLFTIQLPNGTVYPYTGQISVIDRAVDAQTGSIRIRLVFPNPKYYLRAGMSCVLRVRNQDTASQILIPSRAITEQMGEFFVFVVKDTALASKDSTQKGLVAGQYAFQKKVVPGETIGPNTIVKTGLKEGDKVVTEGVQALHEGTAITTANKLGPDQGKGGRGH